MKKAIYFSNEYNPANPVNGAQCIVYDKIEGFQFIDSGKVISVVSKTDSAQNAVIDELKSEIRDLKLQVGGGKFESTDAEGVVTITTNNISSVVATDTTKNISIVNNATPVEKKVSVNAKNVDIDGLVIDAKSKVNPTITIAATGAVDTTKLTVNGKFESSTNQFDVQEATEVKITQSTFAANGYNAIMIGQGKLNVLPKKIVIEGIDFDGEYSLNTITICATDADCEVLIKDCKFNKASNIIRFRNTSNVSGIIAKIENCSFGLWDTLEDSPFNGCFIFEDFKSKSDITPKVDKPKKPATELTEDATDAVKAEWEKYEADCEAYKEYWNKIVDAEITNNRFAPEKLKIELINCTYGADNTPITAETVNGKLGTGAVDQFGYVFRHSGWTNEIGESAQNITPYDPTIYPEIIVK